MTEQAINVVVNDTKTYRVRNTVARVAALNLTLTTLLPFAVDVSERGAGLISASMWVWGGVILTYIGARAVETAVPMIWSRVQ
ncbi:MAG: hypothetical protein FLDDKLPJ_00937 [Phycisphaerae bacterium]|nr:hypothetical protein [Phycisphaerae bacterium]